MTTQPETTQVPIWPVFMVHVLRSLSSGQPRERRDLVEAAQDSAGLSADARAEVLNSGTPRGAQRVGWALSNLGKASLIERPARGTYRITPAGLEWMAAHPAGVVSYSEARSMFHAYWPTPVKTSPESPAVPEPVELIDEDPEELLESGIDTINTLVGSDLLDRLRAVHPDFFEDAVVKLLLAMGYGGAEQRGKRIGGTADGGVDGVIDQDALGLDQVYVQAKRYAEGNTVGRETIQAFIGALAGVGASRGVFITTSSFTAKARDYAEGIPTRLVLIDGQRLVNLMIKYKVGVQVKTTYEVVEIDEDFFE